MVDTHTVSLHDSKEFDDNLGRGSDKDLALARLFCVVDGIERIVKHGGFDHDDGSRFSMALLQLRYLQRLQHVSLQ
jgi:hypothetical protein